MSGQTSLLADQIRRAFAGEAWHGDALLELLKDVGAKAAIAKPIPNAHSIWEILLHIAAWDGAVVRRIEGKAVDLSDEENFPAIKDPSETAWKKAIESVTRTHDELAKAVAAFPDARLGEPVPGKSAQPYYDYYYMFSGIVQHELYHAGQIAMLKKFAGAKGKPPQL
jgi:uncharacterized damage-inducible protein DinB